MCNNQGLEFLQTKEDSVENISSQRLDGLEQKETEDVKKKS